MRSQRDDDDIRWPWESSDPDDSSPPRHSQSAQGGGTPHGSGASRRAPLGKQLAPVPSSSPGWSSSTSPNSRQPQYSVSPDSQHTSTDDFAREMLMAHNQYRAMHQVPPLKLDRSLTRGAQEWAEMIANQDRLEPDTDVKNAHVGENLAMKYNSERTDFTGGEFTDYWYSGIADYDFIDQTPRLQRGSAVLSFSQMVWKASQIVGFGRAVSRRGRVYVVGRYYPGGNSVEGFAENVLPPTTTVRSSRVQRPSFKQQSSGPVMRSAGSRLSETSEPTIGARGVSDKLVSTSKTTAYDSNRTIVTIEEKYVSPDGSTYTRQRKTTYYGEHRNHD